MTLGPFYLFDESSWSSPMNHAMSIFYLSSAEEKACWDDLFKNAKVLLSKSLWKLWKTPLLMTSNLSPAVN